MNKQTILSVIGIFIGIVITKAIFPNPGILHFAFICGVVYGIGASLKAFFEIFKKSKTSTEKDNAIISTSNNEIAATQETEVMSDLKLNNPYYYGFGGWLYLVTAGQLYTLYLAVSTLFEADMPLIRSADWAPLTDPHSDSYSAMWKPFIYTEMAGCVIFILFILLIGYLTVKLSRYYKRAQISLYIFNAIYSTVVLVFMLSINSQYQTHLYSDDDFTKIITQTVVASLIWIPYFLVSKRVKNTFIK